MKAKEDFQVYLPSLEIVNRYALDLAQSKRVLARRTISRDQTEHALRAAGKFLTVIIALLL